MYVTACGYPQRPEEMAGSSGAGVTGHCENLNVDAHLASSNLLISFFNLFLIHKKLYLLEMIIYT